MPQGPCQSCGGSGQGTDYRTDENGNTVAVPRPCYSCGGSGQQELPV